MNYSGDTLCVPVYQTTFKYLMLRNGVTVNIFPSGAHAMKINKYD